VQRAFFFLFSIELLLVLGSGTRLAVGVEDGLLNMNVLLLSKVVVDLVLRVVLLHPGETLTSSQTSLLLIFETILLLELAFVFIVGVGLLLIGREFPLVLPR